MITRRTFTDVFASDEPVAPDGEDLLGRRRFAERVAEQLVSYQASDGLVVAFTGPWGSGKSSLLNMMAGHIPRVAEAAGTDAPIVIRFNPWNFTSQDQLVAALFKEFRVALDKPDRPEQLRKVAGLLSVLETSLGPAMSIGALAGLALPGVVFAGLEKLKDILPALKRRLEDQAAADERSLAQVRDEIAEYLKDAKQRIIVIVDDIDRLDAEEIRLIFKCVKLTVSFPYVTYVLAFDARAVEAALTDDAGGVKGKDYLEKIVQVPFFVPVADRQRLIGVFKQHLYRVLEPFPPERWDESRWRYLYLTTDMERLFSTIRAIKRFTSSLGFQLRLVEHEVDLVDFVGLEAIRLSAPDVYAAITENKDLLTQGQVPSITEPAPAPKVLLDQIFALAPQEIRDVVKRVVFELFPAAESAFNGAKYLVNPADAARDRRIQSPTIFDRYFMLGVPMGQIPRDEIQAMLGGDVPTAELSERVATYTDDGRFSNLCDQIQWLGRQAKPANVIPLAVALLESCERELERTLTAGVGHESADAVLALLDAIPSDAGRRDTAVSIVSGADAPFASAFLAQDALPDKPTAGSRGVPLSEIDARDVRAAYANKWLGEPPARLIKVPEVLLSLIVRLREWGDPKVLQAWSVRMMADETFFLSLARALVEKGQSPGSGPYAKLSERAAEYLELDSARKRARELLDSQKFTGEDLAALQLLADAPQPTAEREPEQDGQRQ